MMGVPENVLVDKELNSQCENWIMCLASITNDLDVSLIM